MDQTLLELGLDIQCLTNQAMIKLATRHCKLSTIFILMDHSIDVVSHVNIEDVLLNPHMDVINYFIIDMGLSVSVENMFEIIRTKNIILISHLIHQFDPNIINENTGMNILYYCIYYNLPSSIIKQLIQHGANMYQSDYLPHFVMLSYYHSSVADQILIMLSHSGFKFDHDKEGMAETFHKSIFWPTMIPMRLMMDHGYGISERDIQLISVMSDKLNYLLKYYYVVETPRYNKNIHFIRCCANGHIQEIRKLLSKK